MPAGKKKIKSNQPKKKIKAFPIIGIGASAGGLDAIGSLFDAMPAEYPEMAFVVVSHLDPSHSSILPELLQKHTQLKVYPVKDGTLPAHGKSASGRCAHLCRHQRD
jgi:two-component system CheB/CheR fusion protein